MEARARRAVAAVGLAVALVAVMGVVYLRPWRAFAPAPPAAPRPTDVSTAGVEQLQFVSAAQGWVVTSSPTSTSLFHTTDGGRQWQRQLDGLTGFGWTLSFFDARRGVVSGTDRRGAALWHTTDGGQHWMRMEMPCQAPSGLVSFVDVSRGWCVALSSRSYSVPAPLPDRLDIALFRTTDGGVHWSQLLATDETRPESGGLRDEGRKTWVWFRDAMAGWMGQSSKGGRAVVYATADGGDHWDRQELPPPDGGWDADMLGLWEDGPDTSTGGRSSPWLVASPITPGPQANEFLSSSHYVYTWRSGMWSGPVKAPTSTGVVQFLDGSHWLVANSPWLMETSDAGATWQTVGHMPTGWLAARLQMVDAGHGWATLFSPLRIGSGQNGPDRLARTDDGGRTWTPVALPS